MSTYILLRNLTDQGIWNIKNVPKQIRATAKSSEDAGGRMIGFYTVMGQYDSMAIIEAPG